MYETWPVPANDLTFSYEWYTDVILGYNGEQRISRRGHPFLKFSANYYMPFSQVSGLISFFERRWDHKFLFPIWPYARQVTSSVTNAATTFVLQGDLSFYRYANSVALYNLDRHCGTVKIVNIVGNTITTDSPFHAVGEFGQNPKQFWFVPLAYCRPENNVSVDIRNSISARSKIAMQTVYPILSVNSDTPIDVLVDERYPAYQNLPVLWGDCVDSDTSIKRLFSDYDMFDSVTAPGEFGYGTPVEFREYENRIIDFGETGYLNIERINAYTSGRKRTFYYPIPITCSRVQGSSADPFTIIVKDVSNSMLLNTGTKIMVQHTGGTFYAEVAGSVRISITEYKLILSGLQNAYGSFAESMLAANIDGLVYVMKKVRLSSDSFEVAVTANKKYETKLLMTEVA
jgi:hypothetical protein